MDEQEFQLARTDFDLDAIRNRLINCICELQSRRNEVGTLKSSLDESQRARATLELEVKNFQRELADLRDQLKIALDALNQKDSIRNGFMENAARQNVQLEALTNDNERLKAKVEASQLKILELSRDNNKLQEQLKVLQGAQKLPGDNADRIWKAMDALNSHLKKLEVDHSTLKETAESSNKLAEEAAAALVNSKNSLAQVQNENLLLKRNIVDLEAKIVSMSYSTESLTETPMQAEENLFKKFEGHLKAVIEELELERETNVKLRRDLSSLLMLQNCSDKPFVNDGGDRRITDEISSTETELMDAS